SSSPAAPRSRIGLTDPRVVIPSFMEAHALGLALSGSRSRQDGSCHEGAAVLALPRRCMVAAGEHLSRCGKAGPDSALDRGGQPRIDIIACEQQILPTRLWPGPQTRWKNLRSEEHTSELQSQ